MSQGLQQQQELKTLRARLDEDQKTWNQKKQGPTSSWKSPGGGSGGQGFGFCKEKGRFWKEEKRAAAATPRPGVSTRSTRSGGRSSGTVPR